MKKTLNAEKRCSVVWTNPLTYDLVLTKHRCVLNPSATDSDGVRRD